MGSVSHVLTLSHVLWSNCVKHGDMWFKRVAVQHVVQESGSPYHIACKELLCSSRHIHIACRELLGMGGPCFLLDESGTQVRAPECTSNFYIRPFTYDGVKYYSVEHAFQALKFPPGSRHV